MSLMPLGIWENAHSRRNAFRALGVGSEDIVLDVGCGTGATLKYMPQFREFHGFDTDGRALETFATRHKHARITLYHRVVTADDVKRIRPTKVVLAGLLHHL